MSVQAHQGDAEAMRGDADAHALVDAAEARRERMRALARARWDRVRENREREAAGEVHDAAGEGDVRMVTTPVRVGGIIRALEREAHKGSPQAARELRAWLVEYPQDNAQLDLASMNAELRRRILARLVAEVEAEDAANETSR